MPFSDKEYKVVSNDGGILGIFFLMENIGCDVFGDQFWPIGKECFVFSINILAFIIIPWNQLCELTFGDIALRIIKL